MDNQTAAENIRNQIEALVFAAIMSVLRRLTAELAAMRNENEMKF